MTNLHASPEKGNVSVSEAEPSQGQLAIVQTEKDSRSSRNERFDWGPGNPDVVLPQQPATAVYKNAFGQIVIRQEDNIGDGEMWIVLNRRDLPTLIDRLQEISAEDAQ
jgi:hypothetical protein